MKPAIVFATLWTGFVAATTYAVTNACDTRYVSEERGYQTVCPHITPAGIAGGVAIWLIGIAIIIAIAWDVEEGRNSR